jgi:AcrR family transcriptional regulator
MSNPIPHGRRAAVRKAPERKPSEPKREATRRLLMTRALALFQKKGVDGTTMRDIAKAAKLSLGAAYYYFPSKEALVFAFYEENQARQREELTGTLRERLGALFHGTLASIRPQRAMLASIIAHLVNPKDPLSAFSSQSQSMREDAIAMFARAVGDAVPAEVRPLVANALWLLHLAAMLVFVHDDSPDQRRTHGLLDDGLDLLVPLLPLLGTPMGQALVARVSAALGRAGITLAAARPS